MLFLTLYIDAAVDETHRLTGLVLQRYTLRNHQQRTRGGEVCVYWTEQDAWKIAGAAHELHLSKHCNVGAAACRLGQKACDSQMIRILVEQHHAGLKLYAKVKNV